MALQSIIFLLLGVTAGLVILNVFLIWHFQKTHRKIDVLLEKGNIRSFKDIFLKQKERNDGLEEMIKEAFLNIKGLEDISKITLQKTGVVRFNPFNEMGGNQSFVIALLDGKNNGFVISSLFGKEGNRVYTKPVKAGKSEYSLSSEEKKAIEKACLPVGKP